VRAAWILGPQDYALYRILGEGEVLIWPPWRKEYVLERKDPLSAHKAYEYRVIA